MDTVAQREYSESYQRIHEFEQSCCVDKILRIVAEEQFPVSVDLMAFGYSHVADELP